MEGAIELISNSEHETISIGKAFGEKLRPNTIICFFGDLGAGKTTFIKGLVQGTADYSQRQVNSPTFVYLNIYQGNKVIYHFDLYRLHDSDEFLNMGFDEALYAGGICCIEWSERIASLLPLECMQVTITYESEFRRRIVIRPPASWKKDEPICI